MGWFDGLKRAVGAKKGGLSVPPLYYPSSDVSPDMVSTQADYPGGQSTGQSPIGGFLGNMSPETLAAPSSLERNGDSAVGTIARSIAAKRAEEARMQAQAQKAQAWDALVTAAKRTQQADPSLLAPTEPKKLTDSQTMIPAGIGVLATLLGARPQYVMPALQNVYGAFQGQNREAAQRQDLANQAKYRQQQGTAQTEYDLAKLGYQGALSDAEIAARNEGDVLQEEVKGQNALDLQRAKDKAAVDRFERELAALPEKKAAEYRGAYEAAIGFGYTPEQAASHAMSKLYQARASGELDVEKAADLKGTRDARIAKMKSATGLDDAQAEHWAKRTENYDEESAIKMALLGLNIEKARIALPGIARDNSPEKSEYDGVKEEYSRVERELDRWSKQLKEANSALNDPIKGSILRSTNPDEFARLTESKREAESAIKAARVKIDTLEKRMSALQKRIVRPQMRPSGGRPAPMGGFVPVDPGYVAPEGKGGMVKFDPSKIKTAADVLKYL